MQRRVFLGNSILRRCGWTASRNWRGAEMFYAWIGWRVEETVSALVPRARLGVWSGEPCGDSAGDGPWPDPVGKIASNPAAPPPAAPFTGGSYGQSFAFRPRAATPDRPPGGQHPRRRHRRRLRG